MIRILSFSSGRADVGILAPVWRALADRDRVELHVMLTGMHRGEDAKRVEVPECVTVHRGGADLGGGLDPVPAVQAMSQIAADAASVIGKTEPDLLMVIGDRLDMIPAAIAGLPFNIPIIHLAGGDLSLGAIDDRVRHALTKLSHVHCVMNTQAAQRVHQMGEEAWRIHVTGATGLDSLVSVPAMTEQDFCADAGLENADGLRIVTVHPETNLRAVDAPLKAVLDALDLHPRPTLFTAPNMDPGGARMRDEIEQYAAARPWASYRVTLGTRLYANAMRHACVMVGNSSSGIIEAAVFGLNVINVGNRQEGRLCGANVHHCAADASEIAELLGRLTTRASGSPATSIYGDGKAADRISRIVNDLPAREVLLHKKFAEPHASFSAPWEIGLYSMAWDGTAS